MPVLPSNPQEQPVAGQVNLQSRPATTQNCLREMVGEVSNWNPEVSDLLIRRWLNNAYRELIDKHLWYGLTVRGELVAPALYNTGSLSLTAGSDQVEGVGTDFTEAMVGRQLRMGMTEPWATIKSVEDGQHLTLELPWGGYTRVSAGFRIFQSIFSLGPNIKRVQMVLNLRQGWKLRLNVPQEVLATYDPRRARVQSPFCLADYVPSPAGEVQFELYPPSYVQQAFPFLASIQPPDLVEDDDYPHAFIRSDLLVKRAIAEALVFGGKNSKYYDPVESNRKEKQFALQLAEMERMDDNLAMKSLLWDWGRYPLAPVPWMDGSPQDSEF